MANTPIFDLTILSEADNAVLWVRKECDALGGFIEEDGQEINAYPTLIRRVVDAADGDAEQNALAFADACVRVGEPVFAECVHDLIACTWMKMEPKEYSAMIRKIFTDAYKGDDEDET